MSTAKVKRNAEVIAKLKKGYTFSEVAKIFGFKSRGTVWGIYKRAKNRKTRTHPCNS